MLSLLCSYKYELTLLAFGMACISLLWMLPLLQFKRVTVALSVALMTNAYHLMGDVITIFGVNVPSATMVLSIVASFVGLMAARTGTGEARLLVETICIAFGLLVAYETILAATGRTEILLTTATYTRYATNAMLLLASYYFYTMTFLMCRWYTSDLTWKRSARWLLGVTVGSVVIYPATVMAVYLNAPDKFDMLSWDGFVVRYLYHAVLVGTIMGMRHLRPDKIHFDV